MSVINNVVVNLTETVKIEHYEGVTLIGINRPEKRNCINTPTAEALLKGKLEVSCRG